MPNICFIVRSFPVFFDGMQILWAVLLHEYRCLQCIRHEHSPCHWVFVAVFHWIVWGLVLNLSPCARMIQILTTFLILLRCKNSSYRFQYWICPCAVRIQQVAVFYLPSMHQISSLEKTKPHQHSILSSLMSKRQNGSPCFQMLLIPWAQRKLTFISGFPRACWRSRRYQESFRCIERTITWIFVRSFRHHFGTIWRTAMSDVLQKQQMIPFITCEISLCPFVCELIFGVKNFDLDFGVQVDSIEQPTKRNSVDSGKKSHCRASSLFVILITRSDVWGNKTNFVQIIDHSLRLLSCLNRVKWWTNFTFVLKQDALFSPVLIRVS